MQKFKDTVNFLKGLFFSHLFVSSSSDSVVLLILLMGSLPLVLLKFPKQLILLGQSQPSGHRDLIFQ